MKKTKLVAILLAVVMLMNVLPVSLIPVSAAEDNVIGSGMTKISDEQTELAPGITQNKVVAFDKNGSRVEMFVATIDTSVDTVKVFANYKNNQNSELGLSTVREQAAAAVAKHPNENFTPIVAINASYYNTVTGRPMGAFVMEGNDVTNDAEGNAYSFFAILKDGTYMIGGVGDYSTYKGQIQEAIGGHYHIVKDGKNTQDKNDLVKYPRQTLGLTADGKLILMTADGNNAPKSVGLTLWEQAEYMRELGCVEAIHLDGGGSATYTSRPFGGTNLEVLNTPSDGAERNVSNSLLVVSTAAADGVFDHAVLSAESSYVTPKSSVKVSAIGADLSGAFAEIPNDISWTLADSTMGTVADGIFTSNGTEGDAVVQMLCEGKVVGETTIHVVVPTALSFDNTSIAVPFGKSLRLNVTATVNEGKNIVTYNDDEIKLELSDKRIGEISGFSFTADNGSSGVTQATITARYLESEIVGTTTVTLGKGSEIVEDFEDGEFSYQYKSIYNKGDTGSVELVTAETGQVRNGKYAMALNLDFSAYLANSYTGRGGASIINWELPNVEKAVAIGFWIYIPEDMGCVWARFRTSHNGKIICMPVGYSASLERPGWYYIYSDLSGLPDNLSIDSWEIYVEDFIDNAEYDYVASEHKNQAGKFTLYIDDITIDYSNAVDDRENPEFSDIMVLYGNNEPTVMKGQTIHDNEIVVSTKASDFAASNAVGLDMSTAKGYLDGLDITEKLTCSSNGTMVLDKMKLSEGTHTFSFEICDLNGNPASITRYITIDATDTAPAITIVPKDYDANNLLAGSLYWIDIKTTDITNISEFTTVINLNGLHDWKAEHMMVADGFEITQCSINNATNDLTLTIKKTDKVISNDDTLLASIPIQTWYKVYSTSNNSWWKRSVVIKTDYGFVKFTDGTTDSFAMSPLDVDTEVNKSGELSNIAGIKLGAWHQHTVVDKPDAEPTCLEEGYRERTYCTECQAIIDWGTTTAATGHNYAVTDGILKCHCGKLFNGVFADGITYHNGIASRGWVGDYYYDNGTLLTGVKLVEGYYYDFGEDGACAGKVKYTGLFYDETVSAWRYSKLGELAVGWQFIDNDWHFFRGDTKVAAVGKIVYKGVTYNFDEQGMTKGAWYNDENGTRYSYGPADYAARSTDYKAFYEIDGKTYNFDENGYLTKGVRALMSGAFVLKKYVYDFGSDGALVGEIKEQGTVLASDGDTYYINEEGYVPMNAGVVKHGDDYYYVLYSGKIAIDSKRGINDSNSNGLLKNGTYYFGLDGKLVTNNPSDTFTGVKADADGNLCYYVNGKLATGNPGLVKVGEDIYDVKWSGKVAVDEWRYIDTENAHGLMEISSAYVKLYFGADGKLATDNSSDNPSDTFTGVKADADGNLCYYVNGKLATGNPGLVKVGEDIYDVKWSGKVAVDEWRYIDTEKAHGLMEISSAYVKLYFGADGKMSVN